MSQELIKVRTGLNKVSSDLKRGQLISAATAVREGARVFGRVAMIKNEQEECVTLLKTACDYLRYSKDITAVFPLTIEYTPGQEQALAALMSQLIEILEEAHLEEAIARHKAYQAEQLEKGHNELQRGAIDEARQTLGKLSQDYSEEAELLLSIGEEFMRADLFEDASKYLALAVRLLPEDAHALNRLGIARRKLRRFDEAEVVYMQALKLETADPNLFFNVGRLYLDWEHWEKAAYYANQALSCAPDFTEAAKMAGYAEKKHRTSGGA